MVHRGEANSGHYYAYLKLGKEKQYYQFNDDVVSLSSIVDALDINFGGKSNASACIFFILFIYLFIFHLFFISIHCYVIINWQFNYFS